MATGTLAEGDYVVHLEHGIGIYRGIATIDVAESTLEVAAVTLNDVGDLEEVKEVLTESVLWPLTYPDTFARLGVSPPRGVLLYGPPGCGKTYLVKAIAGTVTGSVALLTEALHSATDLVASIVAFFSVRAADAPADAEHPYAPLSPNLSPQALLVLTRLVPR